jgi:3-hydroxypropanoate dehydrogenase
MAGINGGTMSADAALAAAREKIEEIRGRISRLDDNSLDLIYRVARNHNWWQDKDVTDDQLREIYDLVKFAPSSANTQPMRILFLRSKESKERLMPVLNEPNREKTMLAPVTAVLGYDPTFWKDIPKNYPIRPEMAKRFEGDATAAEQFGFQQATIQGAYFILAVRAVGLDAGAMGGFDAAGATKEFFDGTPVKANFLVNIGYGHMDGIKGPRLPRYDFDEVCMII